MGVTADDLKLDGLCERMDEMMSSEHVPKPVLLPRGAELTPIVIEATVPGAGKTTLFQRGPR